MSREEEIGSDGLAILDFDFLADDLERLPAGLVPVLVRLGGIELVNVEVLLVDGKDRYPKSDGAVMPDGNPRQCGFSTTNYVQTGCTEMCDVAQARSGVRAVRVIRHDSPSSC